ncbi:MAG: TlpA family protein disulfide reductase [Candidatus Goldbacteria bacterium]|nr:TlpA family protein disulfide reductase [Candidatus Goldiibacteriota bacterium]
MKKLLSLSLAALFVFSLVSCGSSKAPKVSKENGNSVAKAYAAPDFSLTGIDGSTIKLSDYKGKVVILDFWATWCPPCKAEIPFFIELQSQYGKDGLAIIGAALDDAEKVKAFASQYGINYPIALADRDTATTYGGIRGIPTTFVIDKKGNVVRQYVGYRPKEVFEADFKAYK